MYDGDIFVSWGVMETFSCWDILRSGTYILCMMGTFSCHRVLWRHLVVGTFCAQGPIMYDVDIFVSWDVSVLRMSP